MRFVLCTVHLSWKKFKKGACLAALTRVKYGFNTYNGGVQDGVPARRWADEAKEAAQ